MDQTGNKIEHPVKISAIVGIEGDDVWVRAMPPCKPPMLKFS
jgi:hypothetical protein